MVSYNVPLTNYESEQTFITSPTWWSKVEVTLCDFQAML